MTDQKKSVYLKLRRLYERILRDESCVVQEQPHHDYEGATVFGRKFGVVDFQIEKMPIPIEQKRKLFVAFSSIGLVGKVEQGYIFFSNGAKGQPEIAPATQEQVEELPHLPEDWERWMRQIED